MGEEYTEDFFKDFMPESEGGKGKATTDSAGKTVEDKEERKKQLTTIGRELTSEEKAELLELYREHFFTPDGTPKKCQMTQSQLKTLAKKKGGLGIKGYTIMIRKGIDHLKEAIAAEYSAECKAVNAPAAKVEEEPSDTKKEEPVEQEEKEPSVVEEEVGEEPVEQEEVEEETLDLVEECTKLQCELDPKCYRNGIEKEYSKYSEKVLEKEYRKLLEKVSVKKQIKLASLKQTIKTICFKYGYDLPEGLYEMDIPMLEFVIEEYNDKVIKHQYALKKGNFSKLALEATNTMTSAVEELSKVMGTKMLIGYNDNTMSDRETVEMLAETYQDLVEYDPSYAKWGHPLIKTGLILGNRAAKTVKQNKEGTKKTTVVSSPVEVQSTTLQTEQDDGSVEDTGSTYSESTCSQ